jgi:hypothetical protein
MAISAWLVLHICEPAANVINAVMDMMMSKPTINCFRIVKALMSGCADLPIS